MKTTRFSQILISFLLVAASTRAPAQAQSPLTLSTLKIELWPEYDRPAMLVIFAGTLASGVSLPASITLHLPAASGGPFAVAVAEASGNLVNAQYTTTTTGETIAVTLQATTPSFHVEYYDPALKIDGEAREYVFQWTSDFEIEALTLRVQEPVGARNLNGEPALAAAGTGDLGLDYYAAQLGGVNAGEGVSFRLRYDKSTAALSSESLNQTAPAPNPEPATSRSAANNVELAPILLAAAAGVGLLMIGWGIVSVSRARQSGDRRSREPRRRAGSLTPAPHTPPGAASEPARFCTQCGNALQAGDRFCRQCGAAVRP
jgi:hypothetical protein